jgi:hypothetical protein
MLACRRHWFEPPTDLRAKIWDAWRAGDVETHAALRWQAAEFWRSKAEG